MKSQYIKSIAIGVVAFAVAALGFWYFSVSKKRLALPPPPPSEKQAEVYTPEKAAGGLGGNIFEKSQNPISDKLPETNPFGANINPFDGQTNPYKDAYKNPFE